jgi:DDE superfamily endonuclease
LVDPGAAAAAGRGNHPPRWPGYLCLDDVVVEKAFAKRLPWAGWTYSFAKKRKVYGLHVVVLLWRSADRRWRIPVAFRLWRPKRTCAPHRYQTKPRLAARMLTEVRAAGLPVAYLVMDTHYTAGWFTRLAGRLGICWVGTLPPRTTVIWRGRRQPVAELAGRLRLWWRPRLGLRAAAVTVYAPRYGTLRLVVTSNRHGNLESLATNDLAADLSRVVARKRSRWSVETIFRDTKQDAGLEACQCWTDQAMVRHVALVLLTFLVLQQLRLDPSESLGAVKERWQLAVTRQAQPPPLPLKACPAHLRATAQLLSLSHWGAQG